MHDAVLLIAGDFLTVYPSTPGTYPWRRAVFVVAFCCSSLASLVAFAAEPVKWLPADPYRIQAGDVLTVSVWKEPDLQGDVLVRSDGGLSFPLTGDIVAAGMTVEELRAEIRKRLDEYVPDAAVTVALKASGGNRIYVLGKVNRPGEYPFGKPIDVMQAISLAGGMTPYASLNSIHILRRKAGGNQDAIPFRYSDVEQGTGLQQNILLVGGDTVVVP
jgi:polysaccharide export outer membrane protein